MLLFTPGPTPVPEAARVAMASETLHHRTPEFEAIFKEARESLLKLFNMDEAVMIAGSGTAAMEASIVNLCRKKALTVNAGKFGERFGKIVEAHGKELVELKYEWNTPAAVEDILRAIEKHGDIDTFAIQVCESAGGLRHPVEEIAKAIKEKNPNIIVVADGITAVAVEPIDVTNIDILITGSQKALMLPPGLAMLGISQAAIERIGKGRGYYLNLASEIAKQQKNTTAYTAATTLIIGLNKIFELIESAGGKEELYRVTAARSKALIAALEVLNLKIYPKNAAKSMATVIDKDAEKIRKLLKESYGINVAGGQDHLKGKIFRINNMGLIASGDMLWVVDSVESALADLGRLEYNGIAAKTFSQKMKSELA